VRKHRDAKRAETHKTPAELFRRQRELDNAKPVMELHIEKQVQPGLVLVRDKTRKQCTSNGPLFPVVPVILVHVPLVMKIYSTGSGRTRRLFVVVVNSRLTRYLPMFSAISMSCHGAPISNCHTVRAPLK
jgi:hypothetical protein